MDGPVGIASPPSTWTLDAAYAYATKRAVPPADPDGEPLYNCPFPQCAKQFSKRFNLKAHLRVHTGDKPFACPIKGCGRRFMWKSSLTSHRAGHSRKEQELQKRNAVMAGKALAAESVQSAANMAIRSLPPFGHYPDQYHHQHHPQQRQGQQPQSHPLQTPHHQQFHHQLPQQRHQQQQQPHFHPPRQHQPSHQALGQQHAPAQPPSLTQHPQAMYGNIPAQPHQLSHQTESRHVSASQQQPSHLTPSAPFGHHRPSERSPALSYITAEDAQNPSASRPPATHSHPQQQLQRQKQEQSLVKLHQPHRFRQQQKRPSDPFFDSHQQHEQPQASKQPRHNSDSSVPRPSSSQMASYASQKSFNHEHSSGFYTSQQQQTQYIRQERDETVSFAAQHPDQQKLLQEQRHQLERQKRLHEERERLERQEQQMKERQMLLRQQREQHEEEKRRLQQLQEQQERHRRELEQSQRHLAQSTPQHTSPPPMVSESLLTRSSALTGEHRQDGQLPFQRVEDTSRGLRPGQRTSLLSHSPSLAPLSGAIRNEVGGQLKADAPTALPKPSTSALVSPASLGLSTGSILPSPTASMGLTRSPNGFSPQFLFPSHATSPTWATTPTVPAVSMTLASPKAPNTPNSLMDVQMASIHSDHHAGDMSPVPSEVAVSPGLPSPVPPPILPQVSATSRHRRPLNHAKPPLAGPSLSSGPSALLPPLTNVAPANPPTHIDLRGVLEDDGPNCSLPALGSPHTDMSPLPVASPIFGNGHTPISPMQPFSPFSGINSSSAKGKQTTTW